MLNCTQKAIFNTLSPIDTIWSHTYFGPHNFIKIIIPKIEKYRILQHKIHLCLALYNAVLFTIIRTQWSLEGSASVHDALTLNINRYLTR